MCDTNTLQGACQSSGEQSSGVTVVKGNGVIYRITNKLNGKSYVGQTRRRLETRIYEHRHNKDRVGVDAAIAKYGWKNFTVEVIEVCPVEMLNEREKFWIAALNSKAPNGYNLTDGGDGLNVTEELRVKLSAAKKGENHPFYGKHHSAETKAKISAAQKALGIKPPSPKGKKRTPETIARMSAAQKALWARKKATGMTSLTGMTGKHHSAETKAKMSAVKQGEKNPFHGKHHSEETRAKMSAAKKAYFARKKAVENGDKK